MTDLAQLLRRIQELTLRRDELRKQADAGTELEAAERALDRLHWRLAQVARRHATEQLGNAA